MHGLDPAHFEVIAETVNARTWDAHYGVDQPPRKFAYYKADFRRRRPVLGLDYDELRRAFLSDRRQPVTSGRRNKAQPVTFAVMISDPQFGKGDGDGTPGTLARIEHGIEAVCALVERHRAAGWNIADAFVAWTGDNTENVAGHYAMQGFTTDLTLTEQIEATTDTGVLVSGRLAEVVPSVLHAAVPGNHGEVRDGGGKAFTRFRDNYDTHGLRQAGKITAAAPALRRRVRWALPAGDELTLTIRVRDRVHTLLHGHQGKVSAATAHDRIVKWTANQAMGMRAPGESEFIWSGHYHHASIKEVGRRVFVQAPALDGGSAWYAETAGIDTPPGIFTAILTGEPGIAGLVSQTVIAGDPLPPFWTDDAEAVA